MMTMTPTMMTIRRTTTAKATKAGVNPSRKTKENPSIPTPPSTWMKPSTDELTCRTVGELLVIVSQLKRFA